MATEIIDLNDMLINEYEPLRQNRWVLGIDRKDLDAFTLRSAARPQESQGEVVIDYINEKRYLSGKPEPQTIQLVLNDAIDPQQSLKVVEWLNLINERASGRAGYAKNYQKTLYIKMLDPAGAVVQTWELKRSWIQNVDYGTLDYTSAEPVQITLTIRYDKYELVPNAA